MSFIGCVFIESGGIDLASVVSLGVRRVVWNKDISHVVANAMFISHVVANAMFISHVVANAMLWRKNMMGKTRGLGIRGT